MAYEITFFTPKSNYKLKQCSQFCTVLASTADIFRTGA